MEDRGILKEFRVKLYRKLNPLKIVLPVATWEYQVAQQDHHPHGLSNHDNKY
jgi:hypothetical protein